MNSPWQPEPPHYAPRHGPQVPPPPQGYVPPPRRPRPPRRRHRGWLIAGAIFGATLIIGAIGQAVSKPQPPATPKPAAASSSCRLHTSFNYLIRDTTPGLPASAQEIGNVDLGNCTLALSDFAAEAGQAQGECEQIALAADNPGYNANATPAKPLRKVIASAGPGC